jgi:NAD(P)-dependent dehydrogenase (short-subunit alcohol dehydrogenase family)
MNETSLAVITGAAGGMGAPSAVRLAAKGCALLLCDLDAGRLEAVAAPLRASGTQVDILAEDIASPAFPARLIKALGDRPVAALVHTAGLSPTLGDAARILEVNYAATERLVEAVRPRMARGGCAVLISSCSAYMVNSPEFMSVITALVAGNAEPAKAMATTPAAAYPLSKRAVIALVAREAAPFAARGARIVSIAPGLIDTAMGRSEMQASEQMNAMLARTPLGRLGRGDEIAAAAVFLCSPDASYITGCDIKVDGGTLAALGF